MDKEAMTMETCGLPMVTVNYKLQSKQGTLKLLG
jgi:hypothetical protein